MGGSLFKNSLGQKVSETLSQQTCQAWWYMTTISAMPEGEIGESRSKSSSAQNSVTPYLKSKLKQNTLGMCLKWYSACLSTTSP
jgi:hypothetical protein